MIIRYEKGKKGRQKDIRKITRNGDSREVSSSVVQWSHDSLTMALKCIWSKSKDNMLL